MTTLSLDIGGTHVTAALVDDEHVQLIGPSLRLDVEQTWPAHAILDRWAQAAVQTAGRETLSALAISVPGPFDYAAGIARFDEHFHQKLAALAGLDIALALKQRWTGTRLAGLPITFVNDAIAFALGEYLSGRHGAGRLLGVTLGTGLGGGFVDQGRPITSRQDVPKGGLINDLPLRGGLAEDHLSAPGLSRDYHARTGVTENSRQIAERAGKGEAAAQALFAAFGHDLGSVLLPVVRTFNPTHVVIGGQLSRAWPLFGPDLQTSLHPYPVVQSVLLDDASLLGAAHCARHLTVSTADARSASTQGGQL